MKEFKKYLIETIQEKTINEENLDEFFGIGQKNFKSPLMKQTIQWFKNNLKVPEWKFDVEYRTDKKGLKGTSQLNNSSFVLQPNKDGSEIKIIVNDDFYDVTINSIEDLKKLSQDTDMRHFHN